MNNLRFALLLCFGVLQTHSNAQTLKWDSSYQTTYYVQKITLFNQLPNKKNEIVFLGNSITDIGEWAEIWQDIHVKNRGISGDNTFGVLARLDEVVSSFPKKIFIMIGINDIAKNIPDSIILRNYKKIIETIQQKIPKTQLIVQSILPTNHSFTQFANHQNKTQHILYINKELEKICAEKSIVFVNLFPLFLDEENKLSTTYTNDGLHLNGNRYMLWKNTLQQQKLMP